MIQKTYTWFLIAAALSFSFGLWLNGSALQAPDIAQAAEKIELKIQETESELSAVFNNASFVLQAAENILPDDSIKKYFDKPYTFLIYTEDDSLIYWNNNRVLPYPSDIKFITERSVELYKIRGSEYLKIQQPYQLLVNGGRKNYSLVGMVPVYLRYPIQNAYLHDNFPLMPDDFSNYFTLSEKETDFAIKNKTGDVLTHIALAQREAYPIYPQVYWVFMFFIVSFIFVLAAAHVYAYQTFIKKDAPFRALIFFTSILFVLRLLSVLFDFPVVAKHLPMFHLLFGDNCFFWFRSVGDWLLEVGLLLWWSIFVHQSLSQYPQTMPSKKARYWWMAITYATVSFGIFGGQWLFNDLATQTELNFEFGDFANIDKYSVMTLLGLIAQFTAFFLLTHRLFTILHSLPFSRTQRLSVFSLFLAVVLLLNFWLNPSFENSSVLAFSAILYALLMYFFVRLRYGSLLWTNVWLMFFSIFITVNLEENARQNDMEMRQNFARKIALERDERMEKVFPKIENELIQDSYFKIYYSSVYIPVLSVLERISYRYLDSNFFGYYNYTINIFNRNGDLMGYSDQWRDYAEYQRILKSPYTSKTNSPYLYFYSNPDATFSYIGVLPIKEKDNLLGTIIVEFTPKNDNQQSSNIYIELLSLQKSRTEQTYKNFSYALYKNGYLVMNRGNDFSATFNNNLDENTLPTDSPQLIADKEQNYYLVYRATNGYVSVVTVPKEEFWKPISIFSYIYCIGIIILVLIVGVNQLIKRISNGWTLLEFHFEDSLRERIQRGIIIVSLTSFVAVALISVLYFQAEYSEYHQARLKRKVDNTVKTAAWQIKENPNALQGNSLIINLSDIQKIDINLYDLSGKLVTSSETAVFDRHLIGSQIHPLALHLLRDRQQEIIQTEKINDFEYLAAYVPLKDRNQRTIAYLYLPYDLAVDNVARLRDVADFLSALLNVYVIFLLIAGAVAFLIANTVTRPLLVIGDKLNQLQLGAKNEPIEWKNQDEIGELVRQYNRMIEALEESAQQLKRSQRETAWREMAKQVAHEIKNPLTPMKLNIQMLQRVVSSEPEKALKMTSRVANTLIEQIDNLARIASEFSNFAKMPAPENEVFNMIDLVVNVYNLFSEEQDMQLFVQLPDNKCPVYADKNQVLRVLNNLVKNAIQAIPAGKKGEISLILSVEDDKMVRLEVKDNGTGIPDERKPDIFVPNFTTKTSGSGIGLSMSKSIIELAHGRIFFHSQEGIGTSFFVELPLYVPEN